MKKHTEFTNTIKAQAEEFSEVIEYFQQDQEIEAMIALESFAYNHPDAVHHLLSQAVTQNKILLQSLFTYDEANHGMKPKLPDAHAPNLEDAEDALLDFQKTLEIMVDDLIDTFDATSPWESFAGSIFTTVPSLMWYLSMSGNNKTSLSKKTRAYFNDVIREMNQSLGEKDRIPLFVVNSFQSPNSAVSKTNKYDAIATEFGKTHSFKTLAQMEKLFNEDPDVSDIVRGSIYGNEKMYSELVKDTKAYPVAPNLIAYTLAYLEKIQKQAHDICAKLSINQVKGLPTTEMPFAVQHEIIKFFKDFPELTKESFEQGAIEWIEHYAPILYNSFPLNVGARTIVNKRPAQKLYNAIDAESIQLLEGFRACWNGNPLSEETRHAFTLLLARNVDIKMKGGRFEDSMDKLRPHLQNMLLELKINSTEYVTFLVSLLDPRRSTIREYDKRKLSTMLYGALSVISTDWYELPEDVKKPKKFFKELFSFIISVPVNKNQIHRIMDLWTKDRELAVPILKVMYNKHIYCAPTRSTIRIPTNYTNEGSFRMQEFLIDYWETQKDFETTFQGERVNEYYLLFPHLVSSVTGKTLLDSYEFAKQYHDIE